jgi:hypothetical protein
LIPHPPQLFTSLAFVAVSHPFDATPSQSPKPAAHAPTTHALEEHAWIVAFASAQAFVQLPQWFTSVDSLTQLPEQLTSAPPHVIVQALDEHTWPAPQNAPHAPQLAPSDAVLVSHPFAALPSQSA